jgi:acetylglutamate kinase
VDPEPLDLLREHGFVPVLAPLGIGPQGELLNINADLVAGEVAAALGAVKVIFLSDIPGIRGRDGHVLRRVTLSALEALTRDGVIEGGMLPKVEACVRALKGGVGGAYIIDGRLPNALLLKLFTHTGLGTEVAL